MTEKKTAWLTITSEGKRLCAAQCIIDGMIENIYYTEEAPPHTYWTNVVSSNAYRSDNLTHSESTHSLYSFLSLDKSTNMPAFFGDIDCYKYTIDGQNAPHQEKRFDDMSGYDDTKFNQYTEFCKNFGKTPNGILKANEILPNGKIKSNPPKDHLAEYLEEKKNDTDLVLLLGDFDQIIDAPDYSVHSLLNLMKSMIEKVQRTHHIGFILDDKKALHPVVRMLDVDMGTGINSHVSKKEFDQMLTLSGSFKNVGTFDDDDTSGKHLKIKGMQGIKSDQADTKGLFMTIERNQELLTLLIEGINIDKTSENGLCLDISKTQLKSMSKQIIKHINKGKYINGGPDYTHVYNCLDSVSLTVDNEENPNKITVSEAPKEVFVSPDDEETSTRGAILSMIGNTGKRVGEKTIGAVSKTVYDNAPPGAGCWCVCFLSMFMYLMGMGILFESRFISTGLSSMGTITDAFLYSRNGRNQSIKMCILFVVSSFFQLYSYLFGGLVMSILSMLAPVCMMGKSSVECYNLIYDKMISTHDNVRLAQKELYSALESSKTRFNPLSKIFNRAESVEASRGLEEGIKTELINIPTQWKDAKKKYKKTRKIDDVEPTYQHVKDLTEEEDLMDTLRDEYPELYNNITTVINDTDYQNLQNFLEPPRGSKEIAETSTSQKIVNKAKSSLYWLINVPTKVYSGGKYIVLKSVHGLKLASTKSFDGVKYVVVKGADGTKYVVVKSINGVKHIAVKTAGGIKFVALKSFGGVEHVFSKITNLFKRDSPQIEEIGKDIAEKVAENVVEKKEELNSKQIVQDVIENEGEKLNTYITKFSKKQKLLKKMIKKKLQQR